MKIVHVLADGSVKDDIVGHVVKVQEAKDFYKIIKKQRSNNKNEKCKD